MKKLNEKGVVESYRQRAGNYDRSLISFERFARFGFSISTWRRQAVLSLNLKPGDTVVDIGCGTGLNFPLLHKAVTSTGKIIGVDLSQSMLDQAEKTVVANNWKNVDLLCSDAAAFTFPDQTDGVISTFTLILVPDCEKVISKAHASLTPGGRLTVLDMVWPRYCPLWWRHILFFLRSYGVTREVLHRRGWERVSQTMKHLFPDFRVQKFWFGFFYLASGSVIKN